MFLRNFTLKKLIQYACFLLLLSSCYFFKTSIFKDVDPYHQAYDSAENMVMNYKVMKTYSNQRFKGERFFNRYYLSKTLDKLLKHPDLTHSYNLKNHPYEKGYLFKDLLIENGGDISSNHPNVNSIQRVLEFYQVLTIYPDKTFRGERNLTRYEFASFCKSLLQNLNLIQATAPGGYPVHTYSLLKSQGGDIPDTHWSRDSIELALAHQMMYTKDKKNFYGAKKANRFTLAYALNSLTKLLESKS